MEGAMYSLQHHDDPILRQRVEGIRDRILAAQQDDGYLISYFIVKGLDKKWAACAWNTRCTMPVTFSKWLSSTIG
ncbi:MAG: glycoside hydrolase family 127 protein [Phycisphaerales bacterium]|nr:MAG: glycoside hydrolase family 127 protein [Phycisphaerales bacterium]